MKEYHYDAAVIGAGAAGMAAAAEMRSAGMNVALIDREDHLGGILMQCIHNGFGLQEYGEELTGPEFAERSAAKLDGRNVFLDTTVMSISPGDDGALRTLVCASHEGMRKINARAVVLAMGCREKNRGNVRIPGSRPAGIFTAGLAQRLVNIEGYIPGREIVIIGSGDIGLIMARRMSWAGCTVKAVVEIMPYPAGLTRNIVQCLRDFDIPLYLSCQTTNIFGTDRVRGIEVTPMENGAGVPSKSFRIDCDTVLLSVGLIPENELSKAAGVVLNPATSGPLVNSAMMTNIEGIFACGNVLHVHDLADWAAAEGRETGRHVCGFLGGVKPETEIKVKAGSNVRYVNPGRINIKGKNKIYLRSLIVKNDAVLELRLDGKLFKSVKKSHVQPSEMINLDLDAGDFNTAAPGADAHSIMEFAIK